jgi:hypothetical protein
LEKLYPTLIEKSLEIYFQKSKEVVPEEFNYKQPKQLLNQSLEACQKEIEKIIEEECEKVGEASESLLKELSTIHFLEQIALMTDNKDNYSNFLAGYFYSISVSKEKEGKIMESLAALILPLGFLASSLSGKPSIPFITQTEKYGN